MNTFKCHPVKAVLLLCTLVLLYVLYMLFSDEKNVNEFPVRSSRNSRKYMYLLDDSLNGDLSPHSSFVPTFLTENLVQRQPIIPHIIHQVWDTENIPRMYKKWMSTWHHLHPTWEYWFWSLSDVRRLIEKYYGEYLVLYDSYTAPIFRADVMRYFVLYHYGGLYVDLDMEALKPLDNWTLDYNCIMSEENYEHSFIVREQNTSNIVNGVIACRKGHPFLRQAIDSLSKAAGLYFGDYLHATGPYFLNRVYQEYITRTQNLDESDRILVVPPKYFLPTYDHSESETVSGKCYPAKMRHLSPLGQTVCRQIYKKKFQNEVVDDAYTNHHWHHAAMYDEEWKKSDPILIDDIAPHRKKLDDL